MQAYNYYHYFYHLNLLKNVVLCVVSMFAPHRRTMTTIFDTHLVKTPPAGHVVMLCVLKPLTEKIPKRPHIADTYYTYYILHTTFLPVELW